MEKFIKGVILINVLFLFPITYSLYIFIETPFSSLPALVPIIIPLFILAKNLTINRILPKISFIISLGVMIHLLYLIFIALFTHHNVSPFFIFEWIFIFVLSNISLISLISKEYNPQADILTLLTVASICLWFF